jgi:serine/threonine-protein kinase HipA
MKILNVFYESIKVGELRQNDDLIYSFCYADSWLNYSENFPLSLAMPISQKEFGNKITLSFFENLLPEGEVRDVIGRAHLAEGTYEFLREFGNDCAGAVIVSEKDEPPYLSSVGEKKLIDIDKVYEAIDKHHSVAHLIAETDPGYLSLAGAQDKFAAIYENGKFYLPQSGAPTTHIIKVPIHRQGVKDSVYNEYYCMQLAREVGFTVPDCAVLGEGDHPLFVIERYDRRKDNLGNVRRLHQQDFCQAQGVTSEQKYEAKGGPGIKENYQLIIDNVYFKKRVESAHLFLDWICFNLLIGNNDSHSKNISFLFNNGKIELAPFYDLLCTALYPNLKKSFSFLIGDRDDFSRIGKNQFEILEQKLSIKTGTMRERLALVHEKIMSQKDTLAARVLSENKNAVIAKRIAQEITKRSKSLQMQKAL